MGFFFLPVYTVGGMPASIFFFTYDEFFFLFLSFLYIFLFPFEQRAGCQQVFFFYLCKKKNFLFFYTFFSSRFTSGRDSSKWVFVRHTSYSSRGGDKTAVEEGYVPLHLLTRSMTQENYDSGTR